MNGIVFSGLKRFVVDEYGRETWDRALDDAGVGPTVFLAVEAYPDEQFHALAAAVADTAGASRSAVLEAFGRSLADRFAETYGGLIADDWDVLDLVEHVETAVHSPLRDRDTDLDPPELACRREGPDRVVVIYRSERGLCSVAVGLIKGFGDRYGEAISVTETDCVFEGAQHCEIVAAR